jgi:hypothetical protein
MKPSISFEKQLISLERTWRSNYRARALVIGPCIVCKGEMSSLVILADSDWFEVLWVGLIRDAGGEDGEAVAVVLIMVPAGRVPSPRFNNKLCVMAFVDLLPEIDHWSIMEVGLD